MENESGKLDGLSCKDVAFALRDTMNAISGKWKLAIIGTMLYGKTRFTDIERNIPNITPRMLSKELRELELNGVVKRTVIDDIPIVIRYELTDSGKELKPLIVEMMKWGQRHRSAMLSEHEN